MSATWNIPASRSRCIADIEKVVYGAGKGNLQTRRKIGTILYNRGVCAAVLSVEAIRKAQAKYGKGKPMTGEQVRWALENLNITDARLKAAGRDGLLPEIKTACDNHEGSGKVKVQQWDGSQVGAGRRRLDRGQQGLDPPAVPEPRPSSTPRKRASRRVTARRKNKRARAGQCEEVTLSRVSRRYMLRSETAMSTACRACTTY